MAQRRHTPHPLVLILCIALGVWLGFVAIGLTGYLGYRLFLANVPLSQISGPVPATPRAAPAEDRLERYEKRYNAIQQLGSEGLEKRLEQNPQGNAKCQFWTEQYRNAPTEKARGKMEQACG